MMRWLHRLTTLLIITALVAGPPVAAGAWLLRRRWALPTPDTARAWLSDPPPSTLLILVLAGAATALWLLITATVVRQLTRHLARHWRRLRHLPLPTPAQATAGTLAGTAALGIPGLTAPDTDRPAPLTGIAATAADQTPDTRPPRDPPPPGVTLDDGSWIPAHTADTITAMTGLLWLRRRHTYQPGTADADPPPPLPQAVAAITADRPADAATRHVTTVRDLPAGDVILTGPAAASAARGLLVAALMTNTTLGAPRAHIVITAEDLHLLLGPHRAGLPEVPGLHITAAPAHHRTPAGPDPGRGTPVDSTAPRPAGPRPPRMIHVRSRQTHPSIHPVPAGTDPAAGTTVVFGTATGTGGGDTWHVHPDGTCVPAGTGPPETRRLCVLSPQAAADLLHLISQAHGQTPAGPAPAGPTTVPAGTGAGSTVGATAAPPVTLRVLGDCRLTVHDRPVTIRRSAAWQILVLLAADRDGATARHLTATIWPGLPAASITQRLYTTLSDLRTQLKPTLDPPLILHRHDRYRLDPAIVDVDLWQLQTAAHAAGSALTTADRHHAHRRVIASYHGPPAAGHAWPWLAGVRETVHRRVIDAYIDLAADLPAADALTLLHQAITVDPYNEDLHHRAITALITVGDHTAAARLHDTYTRRLAAAGLHPTDIMNHLAQTVSLQNPPNSTSRSAC